jgi:hypothetical protein
VTKRRIGALVALGFVAGGVIGGVIGFVWHAPGRPATWEDIRNWATFVVLVLGFTVAAYELNLQRRQFAEEARRNRGRDDLLDRQRRELQQTERLRQRMQAERIMLKVATDSDAYVYNNSRRPIRDVTCGIESRMPDGDMQIEVVAGGATRMRELEDREPYSGGAFRGGPFRYSLPVAMSSSTSAETLSSRIAGCSPDSPTMRGCVGNSTTRCTWRWWTTGTGKSPGARPYNWPRQMRIGQQQRESAK